MKNIVFILSFSLMLFACSTSLSVLTKQDSLHIKLADTKEKVIELIGKPSMQSDTLFRYNNEGLLIYFKENKVKEIVCTQIFELNPFSGTFYGIKIGETNPKVVQVLGNKYTRKQVSQEIYTLSWKKGKTTIEVDFWDNSEVNQQVHYELIDTSKRIKVY